MSKNPTNGWSIAAVERDTGISRDTLRIWERRYGFPSPDRDSKGERIYSEYQVRRLQLIRRLMDRGRRPGQVVGLDEAPLIELANETEPGLDAEIRRVGPLLEAVRRHEIGVLDSLMVDARARLGLRRSILEFVAPAAKAVGDLWAAGEMQVFEEHLFTRSVTRFLDTAIGGVERGGLDHSVLLATLPGEPHSLGLMMVEVLLLDRGRATFNLGTEVPLEQMVQASAKMGTDTLALSFSSSYPYGRIRTNLVELRSRIPTDTLIWIGGGGAQRLKRLPPGVVRKTLEEL